MKIKWLGFTGNIAFITLHQSFQCLIRCQHISGLGEITARDGSAAILFPIGAPAYAIPKLSADAADNLTNDCLLLHIPES